MDSALSVTSSVTRDHARLTRRGWALIACALIAYGILLAQHMGAYAGGSDSSGYMNHARLLGSGRVHVTPRAIPELNSNDVSPWVYSALGFKLAADGNGLVPTYATGVPLMVLAAAQIVGWTHAGNVVFWFHAVGGVLITYAAGRQFGLSRRASIIAMVMIAGSPVYLFMAVQAMSDVPALVWTTASVVAAWHSRKRTSWSVVAGAAYAMAVLVRPTDALALGPIAVALGLSWRRWLGFAMGGTPGAIFFGLHSQAAYGKFLTTGYGDSAGLETQWIGLTLAHYARWLPLLFTPVVLAFLGLPWLIRRLPRQAIILSTWVLVFAGFYSAYNCTHETWWYLRFLLPAAPAAIVGALLVLQTVTEPRLSARAATLAACGALLFVFTWSTLASQKLGALYSGAGERTYPMTADWLKQHLPANAVVAAMQNSGALFYYTDLTFVRWDALDAPAFARLTTALAKAQRPLYAALFPFETKEQGAFTKHMPTGTWKQIGVVREVTIWQWLPAADGPK